MSELLRKLHLRKLAHDVAEFEDLQALEKIHKSLIRTAAERLEALAKSNDIEGANESDGVDTPDKTGEAAEIDMVGVVGNDDTGDKAREADKIEDADKANKTHKTNQDVDKQVAIVSHQQTPMKKIIVGSAQEGKPPRTIGNIYCASPPLVP